MSNAITLRHGDLRFSALTAGDGPTVLCLHGFPDCHHSFRHQLPFLAAKGFKGISVSLRGYEPSSIPKDADYSLDAIADDILAFIEALGAEKVHLVGHDWGAAIAYTVGAKAPSKCRSLTAMAVPHSGHFVNDAFFLPKQAMLSWYMLFFQLRGFSDWAVRRNDYAFIKWLWRTWSPNWQPEPEELSRVIDTLSQPGVQRAALGYYRAALSPKRLPITPARRRANRYTVPVPTLALTGQNDGCIDATIFQQLTKSSAFPNGLERHVIPEAGHFLHREQPVKVNQLLLDWLTRHQQGG